MERVRPGACWRNRLTARGARVALVEAGPDIPPDRVPPDVADIYPRSYSNPVYMWPGLQVQERPGMSADHVPYSQARVVGGGSTVMGMVALRGLADDYDGWARNGAEGWDWSQVLPAFRSLESDWDFGGSATGLRPGRRATPPSGGLAAIRGGGGRAAARRGFASIGDLNGDDGDGSVRNLPLSATLGQRVSAQPRQCSTAEVRRRPS